MTSEDNAVIAAAKRDAAQRGIAWETYREQLIDYVPAVGDNIAEEHEAAAELLPPVDVERIFEGLEKFRQHAREQPTLEQEVEAFEREFDASQHARLTYDKLDAFIDKFLGGYDLTRSQPTHDLETLEKVSQSFVRKQALWEKWREAAAATEDISQDPRRANEARLRFLKERKK